METTTLVLTMAGTLNDFTPTVLTSIKSSLAKAAGILESLITVRVQSGSVVLQAMMPSTAAASVASQIRSRTLKQLGAVTIESVAVLTPSSAAAVYTPPPSPSLASHQPKSQLNSSSSQTPGPRPGASEQGLIDLGTKATFPAVASSAAEVTDRQGRAFLWLAAAALSLLRGLGVHSAKLI